MWIVAHRGASGTAPENTLASLRRALDLGVTWAEVDVQRTSDGVLVLVHDDSWQRTTGLDRAVGAVPWEIVRDLDAGTWFGPEFRGQHPPRLEAALALTSQGLRLNLEIKSPEQHPNLALQVIEAVRRARAVPHVLLTCFDAAVIDSVVTRAPEMCCGTLAVRGPIEVHPGVSKAVLSAAWILSQPASVQEARHAGLAVWAWTVDRDDEADRLAALGVEAIITNYPERFRGRFAG